MASSWAMRSDMGGAPRVGLAAAAAGVARAYQQVAHRRRRADVIYGRARPLHRAQAEEIAGDDHALDLARPLADLRELRVAQVAFDLVLGDVAVPTVDLDRVVRHVAGDLAGEQLRHRRLGRVRLPAVLQ